MNSHLFHQGRFISAVINTHRLAAKSAPEGCHGCSGVFLVTLLRSGSPLPLLWCFPRYTNAI